MREDVSYNIQRESLSARRAWIEIAEVSGSNQAIIVALRKESVDRNTPGRAPLSRVIGSLSARRAWIEILASSTFCQTSAVALRKESVDRNRM